MMRPFDAPPSSPFAEEHTEAIWLRVAAASDTRSLAMLIVAIHSLGGDRNGRRNELWLAHLRALVPHVRKLASEREALLNNPGRPRWRTSALEYTRIRLSVARLTLEYLICQLHPVPGFRVSLEDGDLFTWRIVVPGMMHTFLHNAEFPLTATFTDEYPTTPPTIKFVYETYHPNVFPSGSVSSSLWDSDCGGAEFSWWPQLRMRDVILHIEQFLVRIDLTSPAQAEAYQFCMQHVERSGRQNMTTDGRLGYAVRLRDSGRPVLRPGGVAFGHAAIIDSKKRIHDSDFIAWKKAALDPDRAFDQAEIFALYPPMRCVE
jgi:ubiquitin-conjugating enzyme E2 I